MEQETDSVGRAIRSVGILGAGLMGFAHTLPQTNIWTHGTLVTAMHGHLAFWGAYGMVLVLLVAEILQLRAQRRTILARLGRLIRMRDSGVNQ